VRALRKVASAIVRAVKALIGVPRAIWRTAHRHPRTALIGLGSLAVVLAAGLITLSVVTTRHTAVERGRAAGKAAGEKMVVTLLSYDYRSSAQDLGQHDNLLTGHFRDDYAALMRNTVLPAAIKQHVSTQTSVTTSSVVSDHGADHVTLLLFLNQTTQSSGSKNPVLNGSRVRMSLDRVGGQWLVSELTPV
jgi:Mce-associated membrane protein